MCGKFWFFEGGVVEVEGGRTSNASWAYEKELQTPVGLMVFGGVGKKKEEQDVFCIRTERAG